jgi:hypothetical protein
MIANTSIPASNLAGVAGIIDPDAYGTGAVSTGWIDMSVWGALMAIVMAGDLGSAATLDAKLEQAKDSGGTAAKDLTGKAITQMTKAGSDDNKQALINLRPDELDVNGGFTHVRLTMTVGTAASDAGAVVLGLHARYGSASDNDAATVDEIVR